ncbi:MAG TPA: hypothetical protein VNW53_11380 [Phenylobacterium sp.]|uniref:hypothetical protein n=1 Tax=Phenylobacterium sp. TaxID=1871053 RepID=UPI002BF85644|nr:hypothetical protein [Phenylobacterium sp.]HXA39594.1 hypothetical protein [Phenylobacterium sp.]
MPYNLGRRLALTNAVAFVPAGASAGAAVTGKAATEEGRDRWVTPLRVRVALMGESLR